MEQINIKDALDSLGIKSTNNGSAVGSHWFTTRGEKIDSLSSFLSSQYFNKEESEDFALDI